MVKRLLQYLLGKLFVYTEVDEYLQERFDEVFDHLDAIREYVDSMASPSKASKPRKTK